MVQVDLGATSLLVYVPPIRDLASRNPDDGAPPLSTPPPVRLFQESKTPGVRSTLEMAVRVETREGFSLR